MFSKTATMKSTNVCYDKISRLKHQLDTADAVIIGAGAGLSTSAGFTYLLPERDSEAGHLH